MSHYAKVLNNIVIDNIAAEENYFLPKLQGGDGFVDTSPGTWIKTSYNTKGGIHYDQNGNPDNGIALRGNYAGIGYIYDPIHDVFYSPRPLDRNSIPCTSWTISAPTWLWTPPTPMPTTALEPNQFHIWDEPTKTWMVL